MSTLEKDQDKANESCSTTKTCSDVKDKEQDQKLADKKTDKAEEKSKEKSGGSCGCG